MIAADYAPRARHARRQRAFRSRARATWQAGIQRTARAWRRHSAAARRVAAEAAFGLAFTALITALLILATLPG